ASERSTSRLIWVMLEPSMTGRAREAISLMLLSFGSNTGWKRKEWRYAKKKMIRNWTNSAKTFAAASIYSHSILLLKIIAPTSTKFIGMTMSDGTANTCL